MYQSVFIDLLPAFQQRRVVAIDDRADKPYATSDSRMQRPAILVDDRVSLATTGLVSAGPLLKRSIEERASRVAVSFSCCRIVLIVSKAGQTQSKHAALSKTNYPKSPHLSAGFRQTPPAFDAQRF
jgi:hypothetical protein